MRHAVQTEHWLVGMIDALRGTIIMIPTTHLLSGLRLAQRALCALLVSLPLAAQTIVPPPAKPKDDNVLELSPFQVRSDDDVPLPPLQPTPRHSTTK